MKKQIKRDCVVCGKSQDIILYQDGTYRGGYYFDFDESVLGKDCEYWECPKCYFMDVIEKKLEICHN